jgi:hypothetical protein
MNLEQAKILRDQHKHLIGQKALVIDANIHDIIIVPYDNFGAFITEYRMYMDEVSNDEMILNFPSKSYSVKIIYDDDPEFINISSDDISEYIKHNSAS